MGMINPNIQNMQKGKTASGGASFNCGDLVASTLNGWPLENVRNLASDMGVDVSKYDHLNNGQQRMILGGCFRKKVKCQDAAVAKFDAQTAAHKNDPEKNKAPEGKRPAPGDEWFTGLAGRWAPPENETDSETAAA